jgi:hypothetical protein
MALGKNMKVEKLIPLEIKKEGLTKEKINVRPEPLLDEVKKEIVENEQPTNVDLDTFFDGLDNSDEEPKNLNLNEDLNKLEEKSTEDLNQPVVEQSLIVDKETHSNPSVFSYQDVETETLKIIFKPSKRKTQKRIFIEIEGAMTINNVEVLYSKVNEVFTSFDHVELNMSNISEIDLTVIQLFHTIRMSYYSLNKFVYINADLSRETRKLLNACGFTEFQTQKIASN